MAQVSGLRGRIEKVGKEISEKYCQFHDKRSGPIMLPTIPSCTFIDVLPENVNLDEQTSEQTKKQTSADKELRQFGNVATHG